MARLLILGGGCRGLQLARGVAEEGHAARVVTRAEARRAEIEAAGGECWIGDPDRLGTLRGALAGVTVGCWLLATATGPAAQLEELYDSRLRSFLEHAIDTTMRGFLYEARGTSVPDATLAAGAEIARRIALHNAISLALVDADPREPEAWLSAARGALAELFE